MEQKKQAKFSTLFPSASSPSAPTLGAILCCVALFMKVAFSCYRLRNPAAQSFRRGFFLSFHLHFR